MGKTAQSKCIYSGIWVEKPTFVDLTLFSTQVGDTFLLCSDGLYNAISEDLLCEGLSIKDVEISAKKLLSLSLENQARDNVSLIVVKGNPGKPTPALA